MELIFFVFGFLVGLLAGLTIVLLIGKWHARRVLMARIDPAELRERLLAMREYGGPDAQHF